MSEITIPYHLVIPTLISFIALLTIFAKSGKLFYKNKTKWVWISAVAFLGCYLVIVGGAAYSDIFYQLDVNRFDLNQDGLFSGKEVTKEQEAEMQRLTNDVGRNFSFITGLVFSALISSGVYFIGKIYQKTRSITPGI
jgi:hypothetical protein